MAETMDADLLVPIGQAARRAGCSQATLRRLVRAGELPAYAQPLDRRLRLVRWPDVEALASPRRAGADMNVVPVGGPERVA